MRYIYFAYGLLKITVLPEESSEHGELIGTSSVWHKAPPKTKKFIIASLLGRTEYSDVHGIVIDDCDNPKPEIKEEEQPNG